MEQAYLGLLFAEIYVFYQDQVGVAGFADPADPP